MTDPSDYILNDRDKKYVEEDLKEEMLPLGLRNIRYLMEVIMSKPDFTDLEKDASLDVEEEDFYEEDDEDLKDEEEEDDVDGNK